MAEKQLSDPSMTPDDALALDLVLGILRDPDRAEAQDRAANDPAFAALVAAHRARLFPAGDVPDGVTSLEVPPRDDSWNAIATRLPRPPGD